MLIMSVEFERKSRKKRRWGRVLEYSSYERKYVFGNNYTELKDKVEKSVANNKGFTIQEVASNNDIRVSVAKQMLNELSSEGKIKLITGSHRVKIYQGAKA
jgi:ribosomal protein S25